MPVIAEPVSSRWSRRLRLERSEAEMERLPVLTLKMKRLLLVIPVRVTIRRHIRLARVSTKGMPTHTKRPNLPMVTVVVLMKNERS